MTDLWRELFKGSPRNEKPDVFLARAIGHAALGALIAWWLPPVGAWALAALYVALKETADWRAGASLGDCLADAGFVALGVASLHPPLWIGLGIMVTEIRELARNA